MSRDPLAGIDLALVSPEVLGILERYGVSPEARVAAGRERARREENRPREFMSIVDDGLDIRAERFPGYVSLTVESVAPVAPVAPVAAGRPGYPRRCITLSARAASELGSFLTGKD
jgi:hypothetical protein